MKHFLLLLAILFCTLSQAQHTAKNPDRPHIYGDINLGYSNYGISGEATLNYRKTNRLISLAYYQSHLCYTGSYNGIPFPNTGTDEHHMAVNSLSASRGFILGKKQASILSVGLSVTKFEYDETEEVHDDLSVKGFFDAIVGNDDHVISSRSRVVPGIPIAYRREFGGQHTIGWVAGLKMDLNPERVFVAATLGLRLGRTK